MEPLSKINFNYIITIHDKEALIRSVVLSVVNCMTTTNSALYAVLDGCKDKSESIIDQVILDYPHYKIVKLYAPDVHELKSINIGLKSSNQIGDGFNIILQDDVILKDFKIEERCISLYSKFDKLGVVSFRHGGNISRKLYNQEKVRDFVYNIIENEVGHSPNYLTMLRTGFFTFKEVAIKSPICIPFKLIREVGVPDEDYAPWDDAAYCYAAIKAGYKNGVFAVDYQSDVEWGTTRKKVQQTKISDVQLKNLNLFKLKNKDIVPLNLDVYNDKRHLIFESNKQYSIGLNKYIGYLISSIVRKLKDFTKQ